MRLSRPGADGWRGDGHARCDRCGRQIVVHGFDVCARADQTDWCPHCGALLEVRVDRWRPLFATRELGRRGGRAWQLGGDLIDKDDCDVLRGLADRIDAEMVELPNVPPRGERAHRG